MPRRCKAWAAGQLLSVREVGGWVEVTRSEILTLIAVIVGPIVAVVITLWVDGRRRDREQKIIVLRLLLATRHIPADPSFLTAINLIPVEFNARRDVMQAYNEFIEATRQRADGVNDDVIQLRSEEHTSELQSLMRISYAVFCL